MRPIRFTVACAQAAALLVVAVPLLVYGEAEWHLRAWKERRRRAREAI